MTRRPLALILLFALLAATLLAATLLAVVLADRIGEQPAPARVDEAPAGTLPAETVTADDGITCTRTSTPAGLAQTCQRATTTTVPPTTVAAPTTTVAATAVPAVWRALAACESSRRWHISDSLHSGGVQFAWSTYAAFRRPGDPLYAHQGTPAQQVAVARRVLAAQGPTAWPVCGPRVGLRRGA